MTLISELNANGLGDSVWFGGLSTADMFLERVVICVATWRTTVTAWVPGLRGPYGVARQKHQRTSVKLLSKYVSVCSSFGDTISYWRSGAKSWT